MADIANTTDTVAGAYVVDITDGEDRAHYFGPMSACFGVGMVAGSMAGELLGTIPSCLARFGDDGKSL